MNNSVATYAKYALYAFVALLIVSFVVKFIIKASIAIVGFLLVLLLALGVATVVLGWWAKHKATSGSSTR